MPIDLPPPPPESPPAIVAPAPAEETIFVDSHGYRYAIRGNTLLPRDVVVRAVEAAAEPKDAVNALREAYLRAGYPLIAVRAEVNNKLIAAQIINGRITELDMPDALKPYYRQLIDQEGLHRNDLIRLSAGADSFLARQGERQTVNFSPAAAAGGSKMTVTTEPVPDAKPWNATLGFNNLGSRYSSRYVAQAFGAVRPGGGLELSANYTQGIPGLSADTAGASYKQGGLTASVVTPWGLYSANYQKTMYQIGEVQAPLYPAGDIGIGTISGSQLVYADDTLRIGLTQGWTHTDNVVSVFDGFYTLTDQHYDYVSLGAAFNKAFSLDGLAGSLSGSGTVSAGYSARRGTLDPKLDGIPNPRFAMVQGSIAYAQSLPLSASLAFTASGQWADSTMPQNQQWVLGGYGNLSAWLPAILVGDSGALARLAATTPTWQWWELSANANVFAEAGLVAYHYTPIGDFKYRAAGDAGLSATVTSRFGTSASLAYAWPLWTHNVSIDRLNAQGRANLYFTLSQAF